MEFIDYVKYRYKFHELDEDSDYHIEIDANDLYLLIKKAEKMGNEMNLFKKTQIVDEKVFQALVDINSQYNGEIKLYSDTDYSNGTITIHIKS